MVVLNRLTQGGEVDIRHLVAVASPRPGATDAAYAFSSALGPYMAGTGTFNSRKYTDNCPR